MSIAQMSAEQYQKTRELLARWDAQNAAAVEAKKANGEYAHRPDPTKRKALEHGTPVSFTYRSKQHTGKVQRHEDRANIDGDGVNYGKVRIYWILSDQNGQTVPVDSERVEPLPHTQEEIDETVAHMGREL